MKSFKMMTMAIAMTVAAMVSFSSCTSNNDDFVAEKSSKANTEVKPTACMMIVTNATTRQNFDIALSIDGKQYQLEDKDTCIVMATPPTSLPATVNFTGSITPKSGVDVYSISEKCIFGVGQGSVEAKFNGYGWSRLNQSFSIGSMPIQFNNKTPERIETLMGYWNKALNKTVTVQ